MSLFSLFISKFPLILKLLRTSQKCFRVDPLVQTTMQSLKAGAVGKGEKGPGGLISETVSKHPLEITIVFL